MPDPIRIVCDIAEPPSTPGWYAVERKQLFDTEPPGRFVEFRWIGSEDLAELSGFQEWCRVTDAKWSRRLSIEVPQ